MMVDYLRSHPDKTPAQLGREIVSARADGVAWKELEARYGLGRTQLYQLWRAAGGRPGRGDRRARRARCDRGGLMAGKAG